jgi:microcystin-dependent protein
MSDCFLGEIRLFAGNRVPEGWHACDGTALEVSSNTALFALIGTTYGGNGVSTFNLPDLRGAVPIHQGTGVGLTARALGAAGGSESVQLTLSQIPSHSHTFTATTTAATSDAPGSNTMTLAAVQPTASGDVRSFYLPAKDTKGTVTEFTLGPEAIKSTGANQEHSNLMLTTAVTYMIAVQGVYPTQS